MDLTSIFVSLFAFFTNILKWCLDGVLWILQSFFYLILDGLLTAVQSLFLAIDISVWLQTYTLNWMGVPPQAIWLFSHLGIAFCLTMIATTLTIRKLIDLIPGVFTWF